MVCALVLRNAAVRSECDHHGGHAQPRHAFGHAALVLRHHHAQGFQRRHAVEKLVDLEGAHHAAAHALVRRQLGDVVAVEQDAALLQFGDGLAVAGQAPVDQLVVGVRGVQEGDAGGHFGRDQLLAGRDLGDHRLEFREEQGDDVDGPGFEQLLHLVEGHVDAFHAAALKAGGADNGKPGVRADYSPNYYAAFAIDPDGYRVEAYCGK